ncbi:phosphoribosyltransferase [Rhodococcus sp. KRD162]|uniref:phosphoribosyltransferase n=1 Tax=Rhodococcus sp. KRD162 TaxID=2729725 RepID=UPI0019CF9E53|nr:phosphoribosyltransferase [Rhodococcus sp. KRD162]
MKSAEFSPSYIVAIQYGAFVPSAEFAKKFRVPVLHVEVDLDTTDVVPVCERVKLKFDIELIANRQILVVDNTITTGKTLRMTLDEIGKVDGVKLISCVVYRPSLNSPNYGSPDHLLFQSRRRVTPLLR